MRAGGYKDLIQVGYWKGRKGLEKKGLDGGRAVWYNMPRGEAWNRS